MADKAVQITLFAFLVLLSLFVLITCVWKIIKLIATYKIESRIEELERLSQEAGSDPLFAGQPLLSPKEARALRRLSILAGIDHRRWSSKSLCHSLRSETNHIGAAGHAENMSTVGENLLGSIQHGFEPPSYPSSTQPGTTAPFRISVSTSISPTRMTEDPKLDSNGGCRHATSVSNFELPEIYPPPFRSSSTTHMNRLRSLGRKSTSFLSIVPRHFFKNLESTSSSPRARPPFSAPPMQVSPPTPPPMPAPTLGCALHGMPKYPPCHTHHEYPKRPDRCYSLWDYASSQRALGAGPSYLTPRPPTASSSRSTSIVSSCQLCTSAARLHHMMTVQHQLNHHHQPISTQIIHNSSNDTAEEEENDVDSGEDEEEEEEDDDNLTTPPPAFYTNPAACQCPLSEISGLKEPVYGDIKTPQKRFSSSS